jgi:hypothetical protein
LAFKTGLTLKFKCALRAIIHGLIGLRGNTVYYKDRALRDEVVAMVIISSALCFSLGGSARLLLAAICAIYRYQLFHRTCEIQCPGSGSYNVIRWMTEWN